MLIVMLLLSIFAIQTLRSFSYETIIRIMKGDFVDKKILIEEVINDPENMEQDNK
jgi:hypothetical protein